MAKQINKKNKQPVVTEVIPEEIGANGLTPTAMNADLKDKFGQVENFKREVNAKTVIKKNDLEKGKATFIQGIMDFLVELGVDPSSPESIKDFLINLEQTDPDLAAIFAFAFDRLMPVEEGVLPEGPPEAPVLQGAPALPETGLPNISVPGAGPPSMGGLPEGGFPSPPESPPTVPGLV